MREELAADQPGGLIVTDLGVQAEAILRGVPTVIVNHHVPRSLPGTNVATVISGVGEEPAPTSSLLAYRCARALMGDAAEDLDWLAALGLVGDLGERAAMSGFPDVMAQVRRKHTAKSLREATTLVNAPRRTSRGDAAPALRVLLTAAGPSDVLSKVDPATSELRAARDEVKAAVDEARKVPPIFAGQVALIRLDSPCLIHALVAQSWIHRLRRHVVIAMNTGFRRGYVHFVARSAAVTNLIAFLQAHAPSLGPDDQFAQGHQRATGGQVRCETWDRFVAGLGFGPEAMAPT
jgi:single-stranded-DNA-specific exonuclease